ncbi:MAG: efflux RND transporter periplasmic adaptor subunit [Hyphomicrobiaceae bacterium]
MTARRLVPYVAGAAIALAGAYFFWPEHFRWLAAVEQSKTAPKKGDGRGRSPPAPVTAAVVVETDMPVILFAPGTVEPLANVAIKPRVDGQIVEVAFKEGDLVNEGDILFRLDDRMIRAQINQAKANIAKDEATLRDAEATLARRETLVQKKIVSEAATDTARAAADALRASIAAGQATLETQKTLLDYLTIRAPITGRTGSLAAKLGATIRAQDSAALVTINQTKPILVAFALPQGELAALRRALGTRATADITVAGTTRRNTVTGTIAFVDNQVDRQTGTLTAKVMVANADELLWPGQSVEVALTVEVKPRTLSVPASAVLPAQQGMIVWTIDADNKVAPRTVSVERIVGQTAYLGDGVKAGERVVTDGQIRLAPGGSVVIEQPRRTPPNTPASEERRTNARG